MREEGDLEVVNIDLLVFFVTLTVLIELDVVLESFLAVGVGLVDLGVLRQLAVGLETSGLIGGVLHDNVALFVLVFTQREENNVTLVDPDLLPELATNVCQTLLTVEAKSLQTAVTQHLHDLRILLAFLLEDEFALLVVVLVLTTSAVLTALYEELACVLNRGNFIMPAHSFHSLASFFATQFASFRRCWWT